MTETPRVHHVLKLDATSSNPDLGLSGFRYSDLYSIDRLGDLLGEFDRFVFDNDPLLFDRFVVYRTAMRSDVAHGGLGEAEESKLLVVLAEYLATFVMRMFGVELEAESLRLRASKDGEIARFKKDFVARRVAKAAAEQIDSATLARLDRIVERVDAALSGREPDEDPEFGLAVSVNRLLAIEREYPATVAAGELAPMPQTRAELRQVLDSLLDDDGSPEAIAPFLSPPPWDASDAASIDAERVAIDGLLQLITRWAAARAKSPSKAWDLKSWSAFHLPKPIDFNRLVTTEPVEPSLPSFGGPEERYRRRDGFKLTDPRFTPRRVTDESHYCIYCQDRKKDSCARGFVERDGSFRLNPLSVQLEGCPLDERIGEMNYLRASGNSIAALAVVMIDNPTVPGTGHRICNDCMKACIFQKQDPVDIPQIETGMLTDVLSLPYGFEIYSLLTRWNPLDARRPVMQPYNGKNVLVVGLGPAGYTLAHHLANEGFGVVGIDGLKIEPLPSDLVGGGGELPRPIANMSALWEELDDRTLAGFGGVSEYGITARWDKNFLKVIRIALERRENIRFYGGVRFGGTISIEDAFNELKFDHIAIATGAGSPTLVKMKNNLARGIRMASDFLMAIQLTGAFKKHSMANLQVRLPAIVIGGGLTATDTATELMAYYPIQVERIRDRYHVLCENFGEETVRSGFTPDEIVILDEFLAHGAEVAAERERAAAAGEKANLLDLVKKWGGVRMVYRKSLYDSPAYRLNHEEVIKAFEEGVEYVERLSPVEAVVDEYGHLTSMKFARQSLEERRWIETSEIIELPARTAMIAAGTKPNVIYEREHPGTFKLDKWGEFFQSHTLDKSDGEFRLREISDPTRESGFFTSYHGGEKRFISFYGDNHPKFAGNVVRAMASAKNGYRHVVDLFADDTAAIDDTEAGHQQRLGSWHSFVDHLDDQLIARVEAVHRLTPTIVEVIVRAPRAATKFKPGQFYRLQNFETNAVEVDGTALMTEGLALTGAWTDPSDGLLSLIILEMGGSSRLCASLKPGEPVVVMGPTGTPTEIPQNETVLLAGGGLGNAVLFPITRALKESGCKVIYFAGYKKASDLFKQDELEAGTDQIIWSVDAGDAIEPRRAQDLGFVGNIVQSMLSYATGAILELPQNSGRNVEMHSLTEVQRLIAIGSDGMMRAVRDARRTVLAPYLSADHIAIGSINSPMQCMMKQVCAQCLQRHVDPATGKESFVFSCFNQDQELDRVDFAHLRARLQQNSVSEKITNLWLTRLIARSGIEMV